MDDTQLPLTDHLAELRNRIFKILISWAVGFAILTGCTIGLYSIVDGMGVRASGTAEGYIIWLFAIEGLPFLGFALWARRGRIRAAFAPHLAVGAGAGAISALAYGIVIWAMSVAPMAQVVALRETSVIMAAALGALFLKEPFGRRRVAAAAVVVAGAVLLRVG